MSTFCTSNFQASELIREKNQQLSTEVRVLKQRYDYLKHLLHDHISCGHCQLVGTRTPKPQILAGTTYCSEERIQQLQQQQQQQQEEQQQQQQQRQHQKQGRELVDAECHQIPCKRAKSCTATRSDSVQVVERVPDVADTVSISLSHSLLNTDDAPKITPALCTLSSDEVSAILTDEIDLNMSDPSSDTSSPGLNPTALFSSLSDQSTSTSSFTPSFFHSMGGAYSPTSSSFGTSDATSGLGTSLSFSNTDLSGNHHNSSYSNENLSLGTFSTVSFPTASTNDISSIQQSNQPCGDSQPSPSTSNGHFLSQQLTFSRAKTNFSPSTSSPYPNRNHSSEQNAASSPYNGPQQTELQMATEVPIKTEDGDSLVGWNPFQLNIENLLALLSSDNGSRSENLTHALCAAENSTGCSLSPITPQCSPTTPSPASVWSDPPQLEHSRPSYTDSVSPSTRGIFTPRGTSSKATTATVCIDTSARSPSDAGNKVMPTPVITKSLPSSTSGCGNMISFKPRAAIRRPSTGVYFPPGPPFHALTTYTTQLSSSSSSSSASSSTLSPPPSVPSPSPSSSHEVPESPSILSGTAGYCEDGRGFGHHLSPVGVNASDYLSTAQLEDISSDDE